MENKGKVVLKWLSQYEGLNDYLYFNTTNLDKNISINTISSDTWLKRYIRDTGVKQYDFAINLIKNLDDGTNDNNLNSFFNIEKFMSWIDEQNKIKNLPKFENAEVLSVQNLQNEPNLASISEDGLFAKYMFQISIKYLIL